MIGVDANALIYAAIESIPQQQIALDVVGSARPLPRLPETNEQLPGA